MKYIKTFEQFINEKYEFINEGNGDYLSRPIFIVIEYDTRNGSLWFAVESPLKKEEYIDLNKDKELRSKLYDEKGITISSHKKWYIMDYSLNYKGEKSGNLASKVGSKFRSAFKQYEKQPDSIGGTRAKEGERLDKNAFKEVCKAAGFKFKGKLAYKSFPNIDAAHKFTEALEFKGLD